MLHGKVARHDRPPKRRHDTIVFRSPISMTNRVALWLAILILIALIADYLLGYGATLFLARQFLDLIEWVAFWR